MRSIPHWIKVSLMTLLAINAAVLPLAYFGGKFFFYRQDFSKDPPNQVFQMVFGKSVPPRVTVSRTSGRQTFTKFWVWMRLEAKPESIDPFLQPFVGDKTYQLSPQDAYRRIRKENVAKKDYVPTDHERVGWDDVYQIAHPEVYNFSINPPLKGSPGLLWIGFVVVDRQKSQIFIHTWGD